MVIDFKILIEATTLCGDRLITQMKNNDTARAKFNRTRAFCSLNDEADRSVEERIFIEAKITT